MRTRDLKVLISIQAIGNLLFNKLISKTETCWRSLTIKRKKGDQPKSFPKKT